MIKIEQPESDEKVTISNSKCFHLRLKQSTSTKYQFKRPKFNKTQYQRTKFNQNSISENQIQTELSRKSPRKLTSGLVDKNSLQRRHKKTVTILRQIIQGWSFVSVGSRNVKSVLSSSVGPRVWVLLVYTDLINSVQSLVHNTHPVCSGQITRQMYIVRISQHFNE